MNERPGLCINTWPATDEDSETGLLEDEGIVVVSIAHSPSTHVAPSLNGISRRIDELTMTVRPLLERIELIHLVTQ